MKQWWPVIAISLLILGGCGAAVNPSTNSGPTTAPATAEAKTTTLGTTLKDLLAGGKEEKCTWTADENGRSSSGTLYISGKKFKQNITIVDPKTQATSQMYSLSDGETMYTWGSAMGGRGVKTSFTDLQSMISGTPTGTSTQSGGPDLSKQYNYQCEPWTASDTDFTPPSNVTFTDMSAQLQQMKDLQKKFGGN